MSNVTLPSKESLRDVGDLKVEDVRAAFSRSKLGGDPVLTIEDRFPDCWITLSLAEAGALRDWLNRAMPASTHEPRARLVKAHKHTCANVQPGSTIDDLCDCGAVVDGKAVSAQPQGACPHTPDGKHATHDGGPDCRYCDGIAQPPPPAPEHSDNCKFWDATYKAECDCGASAQPQGAQWIPISVPPAENQLVVLANVNRFKSDDALGCVKDVGALKNSGHGYYWSTHGEMRAMSSEAFTHWMPISEPCSTATKLPVLPFPCPICDQSMPAKDGEQE